MKTYLRTLRLLCIACALSLGLAAFGSSATERAGTAAPPQPPGETQAETRPLDEGPQDVALPRRGSAPSVTSEDPVDVLDRVVRARFHNHIGFGMARIAAERRFDPETEEERQAVRAVKRAGLKVGLFIVGRGVLAETAPGERRVYNLFGGLWAGRTIAGPIFLNSTEAKRLPDPTLYWDGARRAMLSFAAGGESYDFEVGDWKALARPVRAAESCLQCHATDMEAKAVKVDGRTFYRWEPGSNKLRAGDPLGAMLYVYRRKN
jgi:hypothetical protein